MYRVRPLSKLIWVTAALLAPSAVAFSAEKSPGQIVSVYRGLHARDNWEHDPHPRYRFTLRRQCYCATPNEVRIEVRDGHISRVTDLRDGKDLPKRLWSGYPTIDEVLKTIDDAMTRRNDRLTIEYDRNGGYPKRLLIDPSYLVADDEIDYRIEDVGGF